MAAVGYALSPNMELLISRSSREVGKVKGALEEINSVLMSWIFDPVNVAKTPPSSPLSASLPRLWVCGLSGGQLPVTLLGALRAWISDTPW